MPAGPGWDTMGVVARETGGAESHIANGADANGIAAAAPAAQQQVAEQRGAGPADVRRRSTDVDAGASSSAFQEGNGSLPASGGTQDGKRPASLAALFGEDKDPQPLWLEKEAFMEPDFDCEAYIANVRRFVPLETVRTELRRHVASLKSELVELINRDYNDFVNLSTKLVDVDGAVLRMRVPLTELKAQLLGVRQGVAAAPAALQDGLRRRTEAANARYILELLLDTSNVLSKVEKLLVELEALPSASAPAGSLQEASGGLPPEAAGRDGADSSVSARHRRGLAARMGAGEGATLRGQGAQENGHAGQGVGDSRRSMEYEEGDDEEGEDGSVQGGSRSQRGATGAGDLEEGRSRLLERIGSEMNRLKFNVTKGQDLPFVKSVEKRIAAADATLVAHLGTCLEKGLGSRRRRVVYHCLRAYTALDSASLAEDVFRRVVVASRVASALEQHQQQVRKASQHSADGAAPWKAGPAAAAAAAVAALDLLADVYERIKAEVAGDCKFVSEIVSAADSGLHSFQFLAGGVLKEVQQKLHDARPGAFSPGRPAHFLLNYRASLQFLDFLEGFCSTEVMLRSFRAHPSYEEFLRGWNLPVYYAARFRAIAGQLDEALATPAPQQAHVHGAVRRRGCAPSPQQHEPEPLPEDVPPAPASLALHASVALHECLFKCWSAQVLIPSIADKFLRLTLQLLSRFGGWIQAGVQARQSGSAAEHAGGEWGLAATPDDFIAVWHDVEILAEDAGSQLAALIARALGPMADLALQSTTSEQVQESAQHLRSLGLGLANCVAAIIGDRCIEVLRPVRAIAAMYRVPSRPPPTRHSHYVPGILQPLKVLLAEGSSGEAQALMSAGMRTSVIQLVLEKTTLRFHDLAKEVVATAKRTESSLRLLQQRSMRRPGGAGTGDPGATAAFSDTDKIILQIFLDVQEFGRNVRAMGVEPASLPAFVDLWQCVAPSDRPNVDI